MRSSVAFLIALAASVALGQGHGVKPAEAMSKLDFLKGSWVGKQDFNTGGAPMSGTAVDYVTDAIGGRYLEEKLSTTLPGRAPTDTRHYITYNPNTGMFEAWWFNDTAIGPTELTGKMEGDKLVLMGKPMASGPMAGSMLRATYEKPGDGQLQFTLELGSKSSWRKLFTTTYSLGPSGG